MTTFKKLFSAAIIGVILSASAAHAGQEKKHDKKVNKTERVEERTETRSAE